MNQPITHFNRKGHCKHRKVYATYFLLLLIYKYILKKNFNQKFRPRDWPGQKSFVITISFRILIFAIICHRLKNKVLLSFNQISLDDRLILWTNRWRKNLYTLSKTQVLTLLIYFINQKSLIPTFNIYLSITIVYFLPAYTISYG